MSKSNLTTSQALSKKSHSHSFFVVKADCDMVIKKSSDHPYNHEINPKNWRKKLNED